MPVLRFTEAALNDIKTIASGIAEASASGATGARFAGQLFEKCEHLASLPGMMGRARPDLRRDIRSIAYKGYVIFFRYVDDSLEVVNVLDGRRDIDAFFRDKHG
jgi:plasmid stabilization system protein ParE